VPFTVSLEPIPAAEWTESPILRLRHALEEAGVNVVGIYQAHDQSLWVINPTGQEKKGLIAPIRRDKTRRVSYGTCWEEELCAQCRTQAAAGEGLTPDDPLSSTGLIRGLLQ
jgi:hypothetical protein